MSDKRRKKRKQDDENRIDLFANDDEPSTLGEEPSKAIDLFSDEDEFISSAPTDNKKRTAFSRPTQDSPDTLVADEDGNAPFVEDEPVAPSINEPPSEDGFSQDQAEDANDQPSKKQQFTFDRYGRRQWTDEGSKSSRKKEKYGKRKYIPKAQTLVVVNETAAQRDAAEAEQRSKARDEQRQSQLDKELKRKRTQRKLQLKRRLTILAMIGGIAVVLALIGFLAFRLNRIGFVGTFSRYTQQQLVDISGLQIGTHMLNQDLDAAREKLSQDPYINAKVSYVFPNAVQITIVERVEIAAVRWGLNAEYIALIDKDGIVLNSNSATTNNLLDVHGLSVNGAVNGQRIGELADEQVMAMLDVLNKLREYDLHGRISSFDVYETMGITLYTSEGYRIELGGPTELDTKLTRLKDKWNTIIRTAEQYVRDGNPNPTIYLYSKDGVTVSPYEPDYVVPPSHEPTEPADPTQSSIPYDPEQTTPEPNISTPDPYGYGTTPLPGQSTPIPFLSDPFGG